MAEGLKPSTFPRRAEGGKSGLDIDDVAAGRRGGSQIVGRLLHQVGHGLLGLGGLLQALQRRTLQREEVLQRRPGGGIEDDVIGNCSIPLPFSSAVERLARSRFPFSFCPL